MCYYEAYRHFILKLTGKIKRSFRPVSPLPRQHRDTWEQGETETSVAQHGDSNVRRRGEKEDSDAAAGGVRGGGPSRAAAEGRGRGETGQREGTHSTHCLKDDSRGRRQKPNITC